MSEKEPKQTTKKQVEKRQRGRPKLESGEKGVYEYVLFPTEIVAKVDLLTAKNAVMSQEQLYHHIELIEGIDEVKEYYWKLITSYAIYKALDTLRERQLINKKSLKVTEIANLLNINAFNLKHISIGKGHTSQFLQFLDSLYRYGVNLMEIKYIPGIVMMAYSKFVQVLTK